MLLKITNKCMMNCIHCFENSTIDGRFMEEDVFYKSCIYIKKIFDPRLLLISGGEPTLHPLFKDMTKYSMKHFELVCILSNGTFNDDILKFLVDNKIQTQITNDKRYYPTRIKEHKYKNLVYVDKINSMTPVGRAKDNNLIATRNSPMCYNFRSVTLIKSLKDTISYLESLGKMCSPSINIDGNINCGELSSCHVIGNTIENTSEIELIQNIRNTKCNKCGLFDKLNVIYRMQLGE